MRLVHYHLPGKILWLGLEGIGWVGVPVLGILTILWDKLPVVLPWVHRVCRPEGGQRSHQLLHGRGICPSQYYTCSSCVPQGANDKSSCLSIQCNSSCVMIKFSLLLSNLWYGMLGDQYWSVWGYKYHLWRCVWEFYIFSEVGRNPISSKLQHCHIARKWFKGVYFSSLVHTGVGIFTTLYVVSL